jgi:hypothetical protein
MGASSAEESDDPRSILAKGQYIASFDEASAVDFALQAGEMVMFDNSLVRLWTNHGPDRASSSRGDVPDWAKPPRVRQPGMLLRGVDTTGNFEMSLAPEWSPTALANWSPSSRGAPG